LRSYKDYEKLSVKEMFEQSKDEKNSNTLTRASDMGVRVALMLLMPYIFWLSKYNEAYVSTIHNRQIHLNFDGIMQAFHNLISNANMIVHESGHGICYIISCPQFITALNGTLFQLALPVFFIYYYYRRSNMTLVGLGGIWFAQNLVYVAWYMSYAHDPRRYPFFLGGDAIHDFWYIFSQLGVLEYDWLIAGITRFIAVSVLLGSYLYLLYIAFLKNEKPKRKKRGQKKYEQ